MEAVERFSDRPGGYVQRAEVAMRRGDWTAASERWGDLRSAFPEHASGYVRGAEALVEAARLALGAGASAVGVYGSDAVEQLDLWDAMERISRLR